MSYSFGCKSELEWYMTDSFGHMLNDMFAADFGNSFLFHNLFVNMKAVPRIECHNSKPAQTNNWAPNKSVGNSDKASADSSGRNSNKIVVAQDSSKWWVHCCHNHIAWVARDKRCKQAED